MADRSNRPGSFLTEDERKRVQAVIEDVENRTSGEIRVVVSRSAGGDALEAAKRAFARLRMHQTKERNGVLILLATSSHTFAILGDEGVHRYVGQDGWNHIRDGMAECFRRGDFGGGLVYAVTEVGRVLEEHFPWTSGDADELSNEVVEE